MQEEEVATEIIPLLSSGRASGSKHDSMGSVMELKRKDRKQSIIMPCGRPNHKGSLLGRPQDSPKHAKGPPKEPKDAKTLKPDKTKP